MPIDQVPYGPSAENRKTSNVVSASGEVRGVPDCSNAEDAEYLQSLAERKQAWSVSTVASDRAKPGLAADHKNSHPLQRGKKRNTSNKHRENEISHTDKARSPQQQQQQQQQQQPPLPKNQNARKDDINALVDAADSVSVAERYAAAENAVVEAEAARKKAADHERTLKAKEARLMKMKVTHF